MFKYLQTVFLLLATANLQVARHHSKHTGLCHRGKSGKILKSIYNRGLAILSPALAKFKRKLRRS